MDQKSLDQALKDGQILDLSPDAAARAATFSPAGNNVRYVSAALAKALSPYGVVSHGALRLSSVAGILAYLWASAVASSTDEMRKTHEQPALGSDPRAQLATQPVVRFVLVGGSNDWMAKLV